MAFAMVFFVLYRYIDKWTPNKCFGAPKSLWLFGEKEEQGSGVCFSCKRKTEQSELCSIKVMTGPPKSLWLFGEKEEQGSGRVFFL